MQRLNLLMDEQKPFLNSNLKVADVARMLGTNSAYVSNCINSQKGYTFNQYVNVYRIEHAKRLLRHSPDKKVVEVWSVSGFNTETSFFRTFKLLTGQTPTEWKQQND
jgi:YesN/AraC family two-component response regulator